MFLRGTERILCHMSVLLPLSFNSLWCDLTEAFCPSQGTVWAKQRPGSVCTTMITGVRRGPTRAALSAARGRRTSDCTVMPPGSTPQGLSSWWRRAAGWTTSTAMTGQATKRGHRRLAFTFIFYWCLACTQSNWQQVPTEISASVPTRSRIHLHKCDPVAFTGTEIKAWQVDSLISLQKVS